VTDSDDARVSRVDRRTWLRDVRRANERQEDALADVFDANWGEIDDAHRTYVEAFLSRLPPDARVLDAACGTGKYFAMVLASGRSVVGVDHSSAYLTRALAKHPEVRAEKHDLQELPYVEEFDGVMCVDAMEFVPPEDWPEVLDRFRRALGPGGWLYLTVELARDDEVRALNEQARRSGLPVVDGEVIWDEPDGYYHYHPAMERVRTWIADRGFAIEREAEGPWHDGEYAYHHVLARAR
jgi:SAM-dependent methyltransferase